MVLKPLLLCGCQQVKRGQAAIGKEKAVPIIIGARSGPLWQFPISRIFARLSTAPLLSAAMPVSVQSLMPGWSAMQSALDLVAAGACMHVHNKTVFDC